MDWKFGKINAIIFFAIICLVGVGIAQTVVFDNVADAKAALGKNVEITEVGCFVTDIFKEGTTQAELDGNWTADYHYEYLVDGQKKWTNSYGTGEGHFILVTNNEATAQTIAGKLCDEAKIVAEEQHGSITNVRVQTTIEANAILNQKYTNKIWSNIVEQLES